MSAPVPSNRYSRQWFESFHLSIPESRTDLEVAFMAAFAPLPHFPKIADVCCGAGRHARALARLGYRTTGVDRDAAIIALARQWGGGPSYQEADLRHYAPRPDEFDAIAIMGQSFGHFDAATNAGVLQRLAAGLRNGGRVLLDLWNPDFFGPRQGSRELPGLEGVVHETKHVEGGRLFVDLRYPGGGGERFEWELFTPEAMAALAGPLGLRLIAACTDFDGAVAPCGSKPRIQFVLERA